MFRNMFCRSTLSQVATDVIGSPFFVLFGQWRTECVRWYLWWRYGMVSCLTLINTFLALSIFSIVERQCQKLYRLYGNGTDGENFSMEPQEERYRLDPIEELPEEFPPAYWLNLYFPKWIFFEICISVVFWNKSSNFNKIFLFNFYKTGNEFYKLKCYGERPRTLEANGHEL